LICEFRNFIVFTTLTNQKGLLSW